MVMRSVAWLLIVAVTLPGCATGTRLQSGSRPGAQTDRAPAHQSLIADYVQKLPIGSRVRVHLVDGRQERGTLMDATAERLVIQPRTRIPERPVQIPIDRVAAVELERGNGSVARAIGIGIAAGAGAFFGILLLFAAIYSD